MPGFPLAAIGAGLGLFAKQYQEQQAAAERNKMLQMQLAMFQQQMKDRQSQMSAADAAAGLALSGGGMGTGIQSTPGGASAVPPIGGGMPFAPPVPPMSGRDLGGGLRAGGALASGDDIKQRESGGNYNVGYGGADLSNAPLDQYGFPQWPGKMGPAGMSHAAGAYQFQPGTWRPYAEKLGIHDFSPQSQDAVFNAAHAAEGDRPWAASAPPGGQQMAQAGPQTATDAGTVQLPNGLSVPPPEAMDFGQIVRAIHTQHPEFDNRTLLQAAEIAQKDHLGPAYKQAFDRWKALQEIGQGQQRIDLTRSGQAETERYHNVEAGQGQQRIDLTGQAQKEAGRHNVATEDEAKRAHDLTAKGAANRLQAQVGKTQQAQQMATTQMKTLADRARRLYQAVEENPNLVGARGFGQRVIGGIGEQLGVTKEDPAVADFKAQVQLLQAQLQKPLLGARYFSSRAQQQMDQLVPALARLDNPTAVKAALRNLAETLEGTAQATEAAGQGIGADYSHMSDQELLQSIDIQPGQE
jgi:hypothetical protein